MQICVSPVTSSIEETKTRIGNAEPEYRAELSTRELITRIHALLSTERRTERLICRYLADLADRVRERRDWELGPYADELHAARYHFGLGARDTRERVRVGRALRELPQIERAFIDGQLSYSRVREVTRVATMNDEIIWLELARTLDMRALERRVAAAREPATEKLPGVDVDANLPLIANDYDPKPSYSPARTEWTTAQSVRVTFELSATEWALVERALEGARRASGVSLSDGAALEAVARDAITAQTESMEASDPRRAVVLYECKHCRQSELDTGAGLFELDAASAATVSCGASEHDLSTEGRVVKRGGPLPAAIRRAVLLRDQCRCRVPGCSRRRYVDVHHITAQADGGEHSRNNCLVLCTTHHRLLHDGQLQLNGDAEGELVFRDALGRSISWQATEIKPANDEPTGREAHGDATWPGELKSQGGSSTGDDLPARLLAVIGRRGAWTVDELFERSGMPIRELNHALMLLVLGGRLRQGDLGFEPV